VRKSEERNLKSDPLEEEKTLGTKPFSRKKNKMYIQMR